jgi:hypothetical protein
MNQLITTREQCKLIYLVNSFPEKFEDFIFMNPPENLPNGFDFDFGLMECWVSIHPDETFSVTREKPETVNKLLFIKSVCFSKYSNLYELLYEQY